MEIKRVMTIVNLQAGRGRGKKCYKKLLGWINGADKEKGVSVDVFLTEKVGERSAVNLAKKAVREKYDAILAIVGDGGANEIANGVVGSDIPVLFVQAGNGSDFSRALGVPKDSFNAFNLIFEGTTEQVDVFRMNGRIGVNVFGVGFDAKIARRAESHKSKVGFFPNACFYVVALLQELFSKLEYYKVEERIVDGKKPIRMEIGWATLVSVANGPTCGGVFRLAPQADLKDGLLDICWIKRAGKRRILANLFKAFSGTHLGLPEVRVGRNGKLPRASALVISSPLSENRNLPCHMDGEVLPAAKKYEISVLPKALKVLVPKTPKL